MAGASYASTRPPCPKEFYASNVAQPQRKSRALRKHASDPRPLPSSTCPYPRNTRSKREDEELTSPPYLSSPPPRKAHRAPRGFSTVPEALREGSVRRVTTHQALSGTNRQPRRPLGFVVRSPQLQSPQCNAAAKWAGGEGKRRSRGYPIRAQIWMSGRGLGGAGRGAAGISRRRQRRWQHFSQWSVEGGGAELLC